MLQQYKELFNIKSPNNKESTRRYFTKKKVDQNYNAIKGK